MFRERHQRSFSDGVMYLIQEDGDNDHDRYYCVLVPTVKRQAFEAAMQSPPSTLTDYGRILSQGLGNPDPQRLFSMLAEQYQLSPRG